MDSAQLYKIDTQSEGDFGGFTFKGDPVLN